MTDLPYTGHTTLEHLAEARELNQWMYQTLKPFIKGTVLELGSGTGTFSEFALNDFSCYLSDYEQSYCDALSREFAQQLNFRGAFRLDLETHPDNANETIARYRSHFDSIFAINVLEHIKNEGNALDNAHALLKPGGNMVLFVPAHQILFNELDRSFGHHRRYTKKSIEKAIRDHGFVLTLVRYFNPLGIPGWFTLGTILRKRQLPLSSVALYNKLLPVARIADQLVRGSIGLSLIIIARKS